MPRISLGLGLAFLLGASRALGAGTDSAAARAQLVQGYALKQKGKCDEAIVYFTESVRLDRHPKALLNLADCEEKLRRLSAAQAHFVEAREVAQSLGLGPYDKAAEERLVALEKSIPRLVIKLAREAPLDTVVIRDGVELSLVSLNTPLPIDPGQHAIVVRTSALERRFDVALSEGETRELEVTPIGGRSTLPMPVPVVAPPIAAEPAPQKSGTTPAAAPPASGAPASSPRAAASGSDGARTFGSDVEVTPAGGSASAQKTAGFIAAGAGAVGVTLGIFFAVQFAAKNNALGNVCTPERPCADRSRYDDARDSANAARTMSVVGLAGGAAALGTGLILFLSAPSSSPSAGIAPLTQQNAPRARSGLGALQWAPLWGGGVTGVVAGGTW